MVSTRHQIMMKLQKQVHDYPQKRIDYFTLIVVNPSPNLIDQEKLSIETSFGYSSQDQTIETNTKRILTHVLNIREDNKSIAHPSTRELTPPETVALKIYSVELK